MTHNYRSSPKCSSVSGVIQRSLFFCSTQTPVTNVLRIPFFILLDRLFVLQKTAGWSYLIITSPVILSLGTKSILCLFLCVAYLRESLWMLVMYPYMILVALFFCFGLCFEIQSVANMHFHQKTFHWIIASVNPIAVFTFTFSDYHECFPFRHSNSSIILVGTKWK